LGNRARNISNILKDKKMGMIALVALPIVLIEGGPFFLLVLLIGNWVLKRKIRFVREHKGVESHG
jgi:hypothetical protein